MRLAPGAKRYAVAVLVVGAFGLFVSPSIPLLAAAVAGFVLWFFRDPDRTPAPAGILSPADGKVSVIREEGDRLRVGVFMNVTDVHVNRAPLSGEVREVEHRSGGHLPAFSKESDRNEQVRIDLGEFEVVLIAGAFARRITPYVEEGDRVRRGDRIGHIAFGSRADVLLPEGVESSDLRVEIGDRVTAGETVVADEP